MSDKDPAPKAPKSSDVRPADEAAALPTIRDHAEAKKFAPWQVAAIVARIHGAHDENGARVHKDGVSANTRMSEADFDAAAKLALTGRI